MRETGIILSKRGRIAQLRVLQSPQCNGCHGCIVMGEKQERIIEAVNDMDANVGTLVEFEISPRQVLGHSFLIFLFPLIAMIVGYWIVTFLIPSRGEHSEGYGILGAIVALVVAYLIIRLVDRYWGARHPVTAQIVGYISTAAGPQVPLSCQTTTQNL